METMHVERLREVEGKLQWVTEKETFDLSADFSMDESNLGAEICKMGNLMVRYGTLDAEQNANLKRREEYVKLVKAQTSGRIRSQAEASGTKMTEIKLEEQVTADPIVQQALNSLHVLRADALRCDHWWRAILKKADLLNSMAFRQNAEIKRL